MAFAQAQVHGFAEFTQIPIGRLVEPREVADAVVSLTLGEFSAVTGADLNVSGGMVMY